MMPRIRELTQLSLSLEEIRELFQQGDLVPVYRVLPADLETPVSAFSKIIPRRRTRLFARKC